MMNVVALFLVVTSLVSAGMWSPRPQDQQNSRQKKHVEEVIVKDGHRVVVVEYEDQQGHHPNTKVSISADQDGRRKSSSDISSNDVSSPYKVTRALDSSMENINDAAASVLPNRGQGLSESDGYYSSARELICDAYGKCKHKIASVLEGQKQIVKDTAHEAKDAAQKCFDFKKEVVKKTAHEVKETAQKVGVAVEDAYDAFSEKAQEVGERAKETAHKAKDTVEDAYEKTRETFSDKTQEVGELAEESVEKAAKTAKDMGKTLGTARDMGKTLGGDVQRNVSKVKEKAEEATAEMVTENAAEEVKETTEHAAHKVKTGTVELKNVTEKGLSGVLRKVRDMLYLFRGAIITLFEWIEPLLSTIGLFGLATAYGMCMWVTFASSYVLSRVLSPHQFGMVQSKIYKVYFAAMGSSVGMALLGHLLRHRQKMFSWNNVDGLQNFNLMLAELMILFNMLNLEPRSTKLMFERLKLEKEEGRGRDFGAGTRTEAEQQQVPLQADAEIREQEAVQPQIDRLNETNERLRKLNSYSAILNIMSLMALSWHLVYLAKRLNTSCY